jgi:hypothetical protein
MVELAFAQLLQANKYFMRVAVVVAHKLGELVELQPLEVEMAVLVQPLEFLGLRILAVEVVVVLMAAMAALAS